MTFAEKVRAEVDRQREKHPDAEDVYVECSWHHADALRFPFFTVGSPRLEVTDSDGRAYCVVVVKYEERVEP